MITKKSLKADIDALAEEVRSLSRMVVTDEMKRLRAVEKAYKGQCDLLSQVKLSVKRVAVAEDDGDRLVVIYQPLRVEVPLDENGDPSERNPLFYAINALGLVGMDDYEAINKALKEAKLKKHKTND